MKKLLHLSIGALWMLAALAPAHAQYVGDYAVGDTICRFFTTYQPSTGAAFALAGSPAVEIYKDASDTEDTDDSGATLTASVDSIAGANRICVDTSADGTFYSAGSTFNVILEAGTVDSVSVVGSTILTFSLGNGAAFARLGAPAGASIAADLVTIDDFVDNLEARLGTPSDLGGGATVAANLADIEGQTDDIGAAGAGLTAADDAVMTRLGAPAGASMSADIAAIEAQTDDIGAAGAGLTAVGWNAAWDAEVESEVNDALVALHLDHLLAADYDPAAQPGNAGALFNEIVESDAGAIRFTSNSLELAPTSGGGNMTQIEGVDATDAIDARIAAANILRPTTAGRTLDVTTGGNAGIDLDNIVITNAANAFGVGASGTLSGTHSTTTADLGANAPASSQDVVGMTLTVDGKFRRTITSYDGSTGVATFATVTTAGVNGDQWYLWNTAPGSGATDVNIVTVEGGDASDYFDTLDNPVLAILGTPVDLGVGGATIADNLQEVESQTDDIGAAGAGLTAAGITAAGVRSAVGLATANLDTQLSTIDDFLDTEIGTITTQTSAASLRSAVGLTSANLDTQLAGIESGVDVDSIEGTDATDVIDARIAAAGLATAAALDTVDNYIDTEIAMLLNARTQIIPAGDADGILTADSGDTNTLVDTELTFANDVDIDATYVVRSDGQRCFVDSFSAASDTIEFGACTFTGAWSTQTYKIYPANTQ